MLISSVLEMIEESTMASIEQGMPSRLLEVDMKV